MDNIAKLWSPTDLIAIAVVNLNSAITIDP